ncbi:MAG TPA: sigma-70 family RNA polymerase sigma factor [Tepidisphaeraceae bacterium]|nr:sigma-70 family RNA polymerase sigma factor [Tepidisphaeraceae bacterium]
MDDVTPSTSDADLIRTYARDHSQAAFAELVRRHVDWVYSAARRQVTDPADADDVTQSVFILLARKAGTFGEHPLLTVWLFRVTRLMAADARKLRARRRKHERLAAQHRTDLTTMPPDNDPSPWERLAPILDDAIARLGVKDRQAVLIRYFQRKSHADVARQLGISEGAAKMRVARAVDRLRDLLARRGVTTTSSALSASLTSHTVEAAPATLAAASAAPLATAASTTTASLVKGAVFAMAWSKTKLAIVAVALAALLTTGTVMTVRQHFAAPRAASTAVAAPAGVANHPKNDPEWRKAFDQAYALEPGQVLRRVPPPFIDQRLDWIIQDQAYIAREEIEAGRTSLTVEWDPSAGRVTRQIGFAGGAASLGTILRAVLGAESYRIEAPRHLRRAVIPGDWVIRKGSTLEERAAALEQILGEQAGLAVTIRKRRVPRDAIVVSGTLNPTAAAATVHLYSDQKDTTLSGKGSGVFPGFLQSLARLTGRQVVNESLTPLDRKIGWALHTSGRVGDMPPKRAAAKIDMILANVSRQSGLQFRRETRSVDVWEVTEKEPGNEPTK